MCVVSMIMDDYKEDWSRKYPWTITTGGTYPTPTNPPAVDQATIDEMRKDIERLKRQVEAAKEYDTRNNEPECGLEEKRKVLQDIAKAFKLEIDFL